MELDLHPDDEGGLYQNQLLWKLTGFPGDTKDISDKVLSKAGIKVFHLTDFDPGSSCYRFTDCLTLLKQWYDANEGHIPVIIGLELSQITPACGYGGVCGGEGTNWTLDRLLNIAAEILSVFQKSQLVRPDDVRQDDLTLEQPVLQRGWLTLDECRNRSLFYFDNTPNATDTSSPRELYRKDAPSLETRVVFTNSIPGSPDAAFMERNKPQEPQVREVIQQLVKQGYLVRTRADEPLITNVTEAKIRRELALRSGAQIISTDYPIYGMSTRWGWDYAVMFNGSKVAARCNSSECSGRMPRPKVGENRSVTVVEVQGVLLMG